MRQANETIRSGLPVYKKYKGKQTRYRGKSILKKKYSGINDSRFSGKNKLKRDHEKR